MKLIIDIPEKAYEIFKEWHENNVASIEQSIIANGIPYEERPQGDSISREALLKEVRENKELFESERVYLEGLLLNAQTVEYPFYQEAYQTGYEEGKNEKAKESELVKAYTKGFDTGVVEHTTIGGKNG